MYLLIFRKTALLENGEIITIKRVVILPSAYYITTISKLTVPYINGGFTTNV